MGDYTRVKFYRLADDISLVHLSPTIAKVIRRRQSFLRRVQVAAPLEIRSSGRALDRIPAKVKEGSFFNPCYATSSADVCISLYRDNVLSPWL